MLKAILFSAILAYLSGVEAQPRRERTWLNTNPGNTFFKRISASIWDEFSTNGVFGSRFTVLASDVDRNGRLVLLLRKDDRNFVFLTQGRAFFGSVMDGNFFQFASGVWGDSNRTPLERMERTGQQTANQTISVQVKNGRISYKLVHSGRVNNLPRQNVATEDRPERTWLNTNPGTTFFRRISESRWDEFSTNGTFGSRFTVLASDVDRNDRLVLLLRKDDRNFVFLTEGRAFFGSVMQGIFFQFADGVWGDSDLSPLDGMAIESSDQPTTNQTISVTVKNGKIVYEIVNSGGTNIPLETVRQQLKTPVAWVRHDRISVFREISRNSLWREINAVNNSNFNDFGVEFSRFNRDNVYEAMLRKKIDGLWVFIRGGQAFSSMDRNGVFRLLYTGFWIDELGIPINSLEEETAHSENIIVRDENGQTVVREVTAGDSSFESPVNGTHQTISLQVETVRQPRTIPQAWFKQDSIFFEIERNQLWKEFFFSTGNTLTFDFVEFSRFNSNGVYEVMMRRTGLWVFLRGGEAFSSVTRDGRFTRFATGFFADRFGRPVIDEGNTEPKIITVGNENGQTVVREVTAGDSSFES